jgi:ferredoxin
VPVVKIRVKPGMCQGHARCFAVSRELFELDEGGYIAYTEKVVPEGQEDLAQEGVWDCPEGALELVVEE